MTTYRQHPSINFSRLKQMAKSPLHYKENQISCSQDTLDKGTAIHAAILEPEVFKQTVTFYPKRRAGKEWDAFRADNAGKIVLKVSDYDDVLDAAAAVHAHPAASDLLADLLAVEKECFWTDERTGIECKGKMDGILNSGAVLEVKSTRDCHPTAFPRQVASMHYHAQAAFYCDGMALPDHYFITVNSSAPFDVVVYRTPADVLNEGRRVYGEWLDLLAECEKTGEFLGAVPKGMIELELPAWAIETESTNIDGLGLDWGKKEN